MTIANTNSKISALSTAALCLFSSAVLVNARTVTPTTAELLALVDATNIGLSYVPFTASYTNLLPLAQSAHQELMSDTIYASISASIQNQAKTYGVVQASAYLAASLENFVDINATDAATTKIFNNKRNNLKQRQHAAKLIQSLLGLEKDAKNLGINLDSCNQTMLTNDSALQKNLICMLESMQANNNNKQTNQFKQNILQEVPGLLKKYAVGLDHVIMQLGLLQLLMPVWIDGSAPDISSEQLKALNKLTEQYNAIRHLMARTPELHAQFSLLVAKAPGYVMQGGKLKTADRVLKLLPELARALVLVKLNSKSPIYASVMNQNIQNFTAVHASVVAQRLVQLKDSASLYVGNYTQPPIFQNITEHAAGIAAGVLDQSLIKYLSVHQNSPLDHYIPMAHIDAEQEYQFGKYLSQVNALLPQLLKNPDLMSAFLRIVRLTQDQNFAVTAFDMMLNSMQTPQTKYDTRRGLVTLGWMYGNKDYIANELANVKSGVKHQEQNYATIFRLLQKELFGSIQAIFAAEGGSVEDKPHRTLRAKA